VYVCVKWLFCNDCCGTLFTVKVGHVEHIKPGPLGKAYKHTVSENVCVCGSVCYVSSDYTVEKNIMAASPPTAINTGTMLLLPDNNA